MSAERVVYSIQQTYIIKPVSKSEKRILTCDERIDIPTIEPLPSVKPASYDGQPLTVIPCIELAGESLSKFNLTFETNEGVTVLPIKIPSGEDEPLENPYAHFRYVLALPSGATGVKSCKLMHKATMKEVQHNLTFGIMSQPYNYDNALFGYLTDKSIKNANNIAEMMMVLQYAGINQKTLRTEELPKGVARPTINVSTGETLIYARYDYPISSEPTIHKPKIVVKSDLGNDKTYNLSLNKTNNIVSINLLSGMITAYDGIDGEIIQQFMLDYLGNSVRELTFTSFDDIDSPTLPVILKGWTLFG